MEHKFKNLKKGDKLATTQYALDCYIFKEKKTGRFMGIARNGTSVRVKLDGKTYTRNFSPDFWYHVKETIKEVIVTEDMVGRKIRIID